MSKVNQAEYVSIKSQVRVYVENIIRGLIYKNDRFPQFKTVLYELEQKLCKGVFRLNDLDEKRKLEFMNTVYGWYVMKRSKILFEMDTKTSLKGRDGLSAELKDYKVLRNIELDGFLTILPDLIENVFDKLAVNLGEIPPKGAVWDGLVDLLRTYGLFYLNFKFKHKVEIEKKLTKEYNRIKKFYEEYSAGK